MRDLPDTRVERARSVGDVLAPSPVVADDIESAVQACVEPHRSTWRCENCGVRQVDGTAVCPGVRRCCVCRWLDLASGEVVLRATTPQSIVEEVRRQLDREERRALGDHHG